VPAERPEHAAAGPLASGGVIRIDAAPVSIAVRPGSHVKWLPGFLASPGWGVLAALRPGCPHLSISCPDRTNRGIEIVLTSIRNFSVF